MPLAQMPGKNPHGLFPQLLSRKSYFIRWMICFAITVLIFALYIAEIFPKEAPQAWLVAGGLYSLFGLHIPRLKNAGLSLWLLLLFIIPVAGLVLQIIMFVKPSRPAQPPPSPQLAPKIPSGHEATVTVARSLDQYGEQYTPKPSPAEPASPPRPSVGSSLENDLRSLAALKADGIISDEEFTAKKRGLLGL